MTENKKEEFLSLLEEFRPSLSRFARAMAKDYEDAKDLISETILKAYESFEKLENTQAFQSYLFTIASRTYKRKLWRSRIFSPFGSNDYDNKLIINARAEINLDVEDLYRALNQLSSQKREAITLFEISGFSIEEIADIQSSSISAVKSRLKRGREELANILRTNDKHKFFLHKIEDHDNIKTVDGLYTAKVKI